MKFLFLVLLLIFPCTNSAQTIETEPNNSITDSYVQTITTGSFSGNVEEVSDANDFWKIQFGTSGTYIIFFIIDAGTPTHTTMDITYNSGGFGNSGTLLTSIHGNTQETRTFEANQYYTIKVNTNWASIVNYEFHIQLKDETEPNYSINAGGVQHITGNKISKTGMVHGSIDPDDYWKVDFPADGIYLIKLDIDAGSSNNTSLDIGSDDSDYPANNTDVAVILGNTGKLIEIDSDKYYTFKVNTNYSGVLNYTIRYEFISTGFSTKTGAINFDFSDKTWDDDVFLGSSIEVTSNGQAVTLSTNGTIIGYHSNIRYIGFSSGVSYLKITDNEGKVIVLEDAGISFFGGTTSVAIIFSSLGYINGIQKYTQLSIPEYNSTTGNSSWSLKPYYPNSKLRGDEIRLEGRNYVDSGPELSRFYFASFSLRPFVSGDGSVGDPYEIDGSTQLSEIGNYLDKNFELIGDVEMSGYPENDESGDGWEPIGNSSTPFTGKFDGDGYSISNLFSNKTGTDGVGLFGHTSSTAEIIDVGIVSANITGREYTGAIAGYNQASISGSYSTGSVAALYNVGGLVGRNAGGSIDASFSSADVSITTPGTGYSAGGIVGVNLSGTISNSYARGNITGGTTEAGGFAGYNDGTITNSYSTGTVSGSGNIGGLIGYNNGTVNNSFWDSQNSGQAYSSGGEGKTTSEMKSTSTFANAGWDENIWNRDDDFNDGYPAFAWQNPGGTPLPVELISFSAQASGSNILLNWSTATEVDNYGFEIQRSLRINSGQAVISGRLSEWEKVGFANGHGNSNSPKEYSFEDKSVKNGKYSYRLKQIDIDGNFEYSKEIEVDIKITPLEFNLAQNYPNPFNPYTVISYQLSASSNAKLTVYDVLGNEIVTLINEKQPAGTYAITLNSIDYNLSSGIYLYTLSASGGAGDFVQTKKLLLIK